MNTILNQKSARILIAFGMYLVYELVSDIIDNGYNLKATCDDKTIVLQKQPIMEQEKTLSNEIELSNA